MLTKVIEIDGRKIAYDVRISGRAKRLRLSITRQGLVVTVPKRFIPVSYEKVIRQKSVWILRHLDRTARAKNLAWPVALPGDYPRLVGQAKILIEERLQLYNRVYNCRFGVLRIRNQSTRWGSCSKGGNLSFNYRLIHLPTVLVDYVVVHELCHLIEMNHSPKFWRQVARTVPEHRQRRKELRHYLLR